MTDWRQMEGARGFGSIGRVSGSGPCPSESAGARGRMTHPGGTPSPQLSPMW